MVQKFTSLVLLALLAGCSVFAPAGPALEPTGSAGGPTVTAAVLPAVTAPPAAEQQPAADQQPAGGPAAPAPTLDRAALENFVFQLPYTADGRIPLAGGHFELAQENPPVQVTTDLVEQSAFGDLNGDGVPDAAALLRTNTGGSGSFYDLVALLGGSGGVFQAGSAALGDRQVIRDLRIDGGRILVDYLTQGPQDALCCPSRRVLRAYRVEGGSLSLTSEQILVDEGTAATPVPVQIVIDSPKTGDAAANPLTVTGRIDPAPGSGKLRYVLLDYYNIQLAEGEIDVRGEAGAPGTFEGQITFDPSAASIAILNLEVIDSADGLLLGRTVAQLHLP